MLTANTCFDKIKDDILYDNLRPGRIEIRIDMISNVDRENVAKLCARLMTAEDDKIIFININGRIDNNCIVFSIRWKKSKTFNEI